MKGFREKASPAPYFISYRVTEIAEIRLTASMGALADEEDHQRQHDQLQQHVQRDLHQQRHAQQPAGPQRHVLVHDGQQLIAGTQDALHRGAFLDGGNKHALVG